ncbi:MAG TPA: biotin transporter BioY [Candidatus Hydrogenedentes bacterium]|nr:biotin transporter BioY [Candidatus Hydrogenedentota bacterium]
MIQREAYWPLENLSCSRGRVFVEVAGVACLIAAGALIRFPLPFSPVPVTLQTFGVLLAACLVEPHRAACGAALYLALGVGGIPLFAVSSGATFGYLAGFIFAPHILRLFKNRVLGMCWANVVILSMGALWLSVWPGMTPYHAVMAGLLPFVPGDLIKLVAAYKVADWLAPRHSG